jgi:copper chaperone CopZ
LKRNGSEAIAISSSLMALPGIISAKANTVTGSLTVAYDPAQCDVDEIATHLRATGHLDPGHLDQGFAPRTPDRSIGLALPAGSLGQMLLKAAVEKMVERSAAAMVAAII